MNTESLDLPEVPWPALAKAVRERERLLQERRLTHQRLNALQQDLPRAEEGDRRAYAKAIRDGTADPGTPRTDQARKEIGGTERRLEAVGQALVESTQEISALVARHREEWQADLDAQIAEATAVYGEALESLVAARSKARELAALRAWVGFTKLVPFRGHGDGQVVGLTGVNGDPMPWGQVEAALRREIEETGRRPVPAQAAG